MITDEQKERFKKMNKQSIMLINNARYFMAVTIALAFLGGIFLAFGYSNKSILLVSFGYGLITYVTFINPLRIICKSLAGLYRLKVAEFNMKHEVVEEKVDEYRKEEEKGQENKNVDQWMKYKTRL